MKRTESQNAAREQWLPLGVGQYLVSNYGRVFSHDRLVRTVARGGRESYRRVRGRVLAGNKSPLGYMRVTLDGKPVHVHRLVAQLFVENPERLDTVNHIDGDKLNNQAWNLEWLTASQNVIHAWETGLNTGRAVRCVDTGVVYQSLSAACLEYGLAKGNLSSTLRGKQKTWGGHRWEYA